MTPAYAAPEQLRAGYTGIQTDVYSLGVILFELLASHLPFDLSQATPGQADDMILNRQPERPSTVAERNARAQSKELEKADWDDLDLLCLTALHKDPERRYQSVEALVRDLNRYLEGKPLEARPDSAVYTLRKFLARNRRPALAAALVLLTVAGLTVFFVLRLARSRREAVTAAMRAQRIEQFMIHLFDGDNRTGPSSQLSAVEVLNRGALEADSLQGDPQTQAELQQTLGDLYEKLGQVERAETLLRAALKTRTALFTHHSVAVAQTLLSLGFVRAERSNGAEEARSLAREGYAIDSSLRPAASFALAHDQIMLGSVLHLSGDSPAAIKVLQAAVDRLSGPGAPAADLSWGLNALATAKQETGDLAGAKSIYLRSLALGRKLYGDANPVVAEDLSNLGTIAFAQQNFREAESAYRSALKATTAWYGRDNVIVASIASYLGASLLKEGKLSEAEPLLQQGLATHERFYGNGNPNVAEDLNFLAVWAQESGKIAEASGYFQKALRMTREVFGAANLRTCVALSNFAEFKRKTGQFPAAEEMSREALLIARKTVPPDHMYSGILQLAMGKILHYEKRYTEAEPYLVNACSILARQGNPSMEVLQTARRFLAANQSALRPR